MIKSYQTPSSEIWLRQFVAVHFSKPFPVRARMASWGLRQTRIWNFTSDWTLFWIAQIPRQHIVAENSWRHSTWDLCINHQMQGWTSHVCTGVTVLVDGWTRAQGVKWISVNSLYVFSVYELWTIFTLNPFLRIPPTITRSILPHVMENLVMRSTPMTREHIYTIHTLDTERLMAKV